jgi:hypothetical protein
MGREQEKDSLRAKISPGFAARLERLGPKDKVRPIVMLRGGVAPRPAAKRHSPAERAAAVKGVRRSLTKALPDIDRILERHQGKRLKSEVDALGTVPIITTAAGIDALTTLEYVKAILEDQPVRSASSAKP